MARYRGDPGLFGAIGSAISGITGIASKILPGPLGAAAGTVSKLTANKPSTTTRAMPAIGAIMGGTAGRSIPSATGNLKSQLEASAYKGEGSIVPSRVRAVANVQPRIMDGTKLYRDDGIVTACPAGHHPNKSAYFEYEPQIDAVIFHPPGTKCVKNRRRNPLNPKAADRAITRLGQTKRAMQKLNRFTIRAKKCK